uniref:Uncharacterized protein n=1 Tax=Anguilla anguilla TaxID=7936 RepID=A0A0E9XBG6_ANGAN
MRQKLICYSGVDLRLKVHLYITEHSSDRWTLGNSLLFGQLNHRTASTGDFPAAVSPSGDRNKKADTLQS